jgi:hypothetical protein
MLATSTWDPNKPPPTITLTGEELEQMRAEIAAGLLPPDFEKRYRDAVDANVFGADAPRDRHGKRQEVGIGSKGHETVNHFAALKKNESLGLELPGTYDKAIAEIWKRDPERAQKLGLPGRK